MYKIHHVDTCFPDYFCGHHLPVVQVTVDSSTIYGSLKSDMLYHYLVIDHLYDDPRFGDDGIDCDLYDKAVETLFDGIDLSSKPEFTKYISEPDDGDDCIDNVYAFFVIDVED